MSPVNKVGLEHFNCLCKIKKKDFFLNMYYGRSQTAFNTHTDKIQGIALVGVKALL